jgi:8-oxo-dGTP pyrophosphatase MutT (NUDIX family)
MTTMTDDPTPPPVRVGDWTRRTRATAYVNPWITIWHDEVIRPDGSDGIYGVVHMANLAVGVVAIDDQDRVVLVGQHRYALDAFSWELPEGGSPFSEDPLAGAQRELHEETGVTATDWEEIARLDLSNSVTDERAVLYLATGLTRGEAQPDATEALSIRWVPFQEALEMTADGRITDVMSVLGIERVALRRLQAGRDAGRPG